MRIFFLTLLLLAACAPLQIPGIVTVPAPGVTRVAASTLIQAQPSAQTAVETRTAPPKASQTVPATLPIPTRPSSLDPTVLPTDTAEPKRALPQYTINASMDYYAKTLDVQQQIDFPNPGDSAITDILLSVQPSRIPDVFELLELRYNDQAVSDYTLESQQLRWTLHAPLAVGETARIDLHYKLTLPLIEQGDPNLTRPKIFGVTERQVNLTDWYPMLVPFQSKVGWLLHDPWYYGEHLVYPLANFDVTLHFTDPVNVPVIAASGSAEKTADGEHFTLENGRDFVMTMGRQLESVSAKVGKVTISSYYYPGSENAGQAVLDATKLALQTFSEMFGDYPHSTLAAVQGDFNDGMEFDGLYYLSDSFYNLYDNTEKNYLVMIAAHETSHQWWFGRVGSDQDTQPWLDEALATYCEKLFYEKNYPQALDWWWAYRINFYQPEGKIDENVKSYGGFRPYTNAVYFQGARFLDELRQETGDDTFFAFLKDYAAQMDGKIADSADFFRILKEHSHADISPLLAKYFTK